MSGPAWGLKGLERRLRYFFRPTARLTKQVQNLNSKLGPEKVRNLLAEPLVRQIRTLPPSTPLEEAEFSVYSQWGEDGIIQFLLAHVPCPNRTFVEFGVEDFSEANLRFLIERSPWRGLVMDGRPDLEALIQATGLAWRRHIQAKSVFITAENINGLVRPSIVEPELDILSIDLDGVDYWVWKAFSAYSPRIVIAEYNSLFGPSATITVPYQPDFQRAKEHHSHLYFGASLGALITLAQKKGYSCVGSTSTGVNAFFVRNDVRGRLPSLTSEQAWRDLCVRESRNPEGKMSYISGSDRVKAIEHLPAVDVRTGQTAPIRTFMAAGPKESTSL
ncbi:MAG: hypothetical protein IPQ13_02225 [Holophagaceae bacterium]|nr:hypothetical protein [Holophagaceae bacterium]